MMENQQSPDSKAAEKVKPKQLESAAQELSSMFRLTFPNNV